MTPMKRAHAKKNLLPEREIVVRARRVVIKLGSSVLADPHGGLKQKIFSSLARSCARLLQEEQMQVIIVSSGSIACGMQALGYHRRPRSTGVLQACAATGQPLLMHAYEKAFAPLQVRSGQVLLTRDGLVDRKRIIFAKHTLHALLKHHIVPIVNENDTVAVDEIKVGDNDTLAAHVASLVDADLLLLLTDCDGLYTKNPRLHADAEHIRLVKDIDRETVSMAAGSLDFTRVGGMATKIEAARIAGRYGIPTVIGSGLDPKSIRNILAGAESGTLFMPSQLALKSRKHWIAFALKPMGRLALDAGACRAIAQERKSLLAAGITKVEGHFKIGDPVDLVSPDGKSIARGLVSYSADELQRIQGQQSRAISAILGYRYVDEVITREDLVLLDEE